MSCCLNRTCGNFLIVLVVEGYDLLKMEMVKLDLMTHVEDNIPIPILRHLKDLTRDQNLENLII